LRLSKLIFIVKELHYEYYHLYTYTVKYFKNVNVCYNQCMFIDKLQPHVIIVRGGTDPKHREDSLTSGSSVFHTLRGSHHVNDVHVTVSGTYELDGRVIDPTDLLALGGTIFHTLRGRDGVRLQRSCREQGIAHTGNAHTAFSEVGRVGQRQILRRTGVHTIPYWRFEHDFSPAANGLHQAIANQLRYPVVITPLPDAFSVDALVVRSKDELMEVLQACLSLGAETTVSDTYEGNVYAALVMNSFRGQSPYVFPVRELLHNHEVANAFSRSEAVHGQASSQVSADVPALAKEVFSKLHLHDLAEVHILETPEDELYVLDVDPHPDLDRHSLLVDVAGDVGSTLEEIFSLIVKNAQNRYNKITSPYKQQTVSVEK
jgi:D-alanine-D-alanine ligase-like ATP-grasp enzyme